MQQQCFDEAFNELHTVLDYVRWSASQFEAADIYFGHGTDNAWDEAVSLLCFVLHLPFDGVGACMNARLTSTEKRTFLALVARRINERIPAAYLTQNAWFCGLQFYVDERVLVPRSPIAELIQRQFSDVIDPSAVHHILDMCTGSACIAVACAEAFPDSMVDAVDISVDALAVAEVNIEAHGLHERVMPIQSDVFTNLHGVKYDIIVSNPPYVDAEDLSMMPDEYHHEPEIGLGSGEDGLDITRCILAEASEHLSEHGVLIVEVGNSMIQLQTKYPQVPFHWFEFEQGGDGVFALTKAQLIKYQDSFIDQPII